jgi:molybdopterin synthase sulfur carrier subunit
MIVNFYATLRQIVGKKTLEIEMPDGGTVRELVAEIIQAYPPMRRELFDENGELYHHVHILVNGRDTPYLENAIDTPLRPDDIVNVFPAVGGG